MKIIKDGLMLCEDCTQAVINCDYSGLDYSYNERESEKRMQEINKGMERLGVGLCHAGIEREDFSTRQCNCCLTKLAGSREYFIILR